MKKFLILFMTCLLLTQAMPACAREEITDLHALIDDEVYAVLNDDDTKYFTYHKVRASNDIYLTVQVNYDQSDGSVSTLYFRPHVQTIHYLYYYTLNIHDEYVGGYVATLNYPAFENTSDFPYNLNMSVTKVNKPTVLSVVGHLTYYTVQISGGLYQITYNAVINVNQNGQVKSVSQNTVNGAYYYYYSGT